MTSVQSTLLKVAHVITLLFIGKVIVGTDGGVVSAAPIVSIPVLITLFVHEAWTVKFIVPATAEEVVDIVRVVVDEVILPEKVA